jgi:23S rRNA (adenine2503-C2)-methyltransferase
VRYFRKTGRRISFEYTLLSGKNDSEADALRLARLLKKYFGREPIHVNLIRVNEVKETAFRHGTKESAQRFMRTLLKEGVNATVRRRLGTDVDAACGQLRHKEETGGEENDG